MVQVAPGINYPDPWWIVRARRVSVNSGAAPARQFCGPPSTNWPVMPQAIPDGVDATMRAPTYNASRSTGPGIGRQPVLPAVQQNAFKPVPR